MYTIKKLVMQSAKECIPDAFKDAKTIYFGDPPECNPLKPDSKNVWVHVDWDGDGVLKTYLCEFITVDTWQIYEYKSAEIKQ